MTIDATTTSTAEALDMLEDISARARAMDLGLVAYPVEDVEAVYAALRAVRGKNRAAMIGAHPDPITDAAERAVLGL